MQESFQDQLEEQKRLYTIGQAIAAQIELPQVCNRLVEAGIYVADADAGYLFLRGDDSGDVRLVSRMRQGDQEAQTVDQVTKDASVERVMRLGSPHILSEAALATSDVPAPAVIDVPLKVRDRCTGVLRVLRFDQDRPFGALDYHRLSVLTSYAVLAVENADLVAGIQNAMERMAICQISTFF